MHDWSDFQEVLAIFSVMGCLYGSIYSCTGIAAIIQNKKFFLNENDLFRFRIYEIVGFLIFFSSVLVFLHLL